MTTLKKTFLVIFTRNADVREIKCNLWIVIQLGHISIGFMMSY